MTNRSVIFWFLTAIILAIFSPILHFGCGYFTGWMLKVFIGDIVSSGFNLLFNTSRFTSEWLPITCGTLAIIGSFFKVNSSSNSKKN